MMRKDRKRYNREFKFKAVQRINGKSVTEVARELGISVHLLCCWCDEPQAAGEEAFPGSRHKASITASGECAVPRGYHDV